MTIDEIDKLLSDAGAEAIRMMLMAGMPGGTRTQRVKNMAFAEGCSHAVKSIREAIRQADEAGSPA